MSELNNKLLAHDKSTKHEQHMKAKSNMESYLTTKKSQR